MYNILKGRLLPVRVCLIASMLMLLAIAQALLTLLGAASERTGMDAYLKANTVKRRTHSLFRQGSY